MFRQCFIHEIRFFSMNGLLSPLLFLLLLTTAPSKGTPSSPGITGKNGGDSAIVAIHTDSGTMRIHLYDETPKHRDNFLKLAEKGFYDSTSFHRVIEGFMIQGGDPYSKEENPKERVGKGGPGYTLEAEIRKGLFHKKGALGAARKGDRKNPERRSNGSQFYIVQGKRFSKKNLERLGERMAKRDTGFVFSQEQIQAYTKKGGAPHLDGSYTVFGEVIDGMEVIDKIAAVGTDPANNRPKEPVRMDVEVIQKP